MGARSVEELIAWQLASELEREVFAFTARGAAFRDLRFRNQMRDAAHSATRNTAEGFGRFRPKEFARFLEIAHASLDETKDGLYVAHRRQYLSNADFGRLMRLACRALTANARLASYLRSCRRQPTP